MNNFSRRQFIKATGISVAALSSGDFGFAQLNQKTNELAILCRKLALLWGYKLLSLQIKDSKHPHYGAIIYPAENIIHGRIGDTFYPFLHLANHTKNNAFLDAAIILYQWMERTVSQPDGSWLNELRANSWKGTTVFSSIALAEAIEQHGDLLDPSFKTQIENRLQQSGSYIYNNFSVDYGNINYPVAGAYCLSLLGKILDNKKFSEKGKALAKSVIPFFTKKNSFLQGEGTPYYQPSAKGCYSVDLGYNVEESLPSLVQYSLLTGDHEMLELVLESMNTHLEFMLPDGGWDNSWGTRNYKWTYWGSRTSDGCLPAYALMADRDPNYYTAALLNTQLLHKHTHDGLLYGGPHYKSHNIPASLHHSFCHLKAVVTVLDHGIEKKKTNQVPALPRSLYTGTKFFEDIQTWLITTGPFKATVTGYDRNYKDFTAGHASGGALSLLWHEQVGILFCASMNKYQLFESGNMQKDNAPESICLTPRIELMISGTTYTNLNDFSATIHEQVKAPKTIIQTRSRLVDHKQQSPTNGEFQVAIDYTFTNDEVLIKFSCIKPAESNDTLSIIFPLIASSDDKATWKSPSELIVKRNKSSIIVKANSNISTLPTNSHNRVFNFVPGLEAIPLYVNAQELTLSIKVA